MTARIYWTSRIKPWNMELYMHQYTKIQNSWYKPFTSRYCSQHASAQHQPKTTTERWVLNISSMIRCFPGETGDGRAIHPISSQNKPSHFHCLRWVSHASRHSKVREKSSPSINGDSPEQKVKRIGETVSDFRWKEWLMVMACIHTSYIHIEMFIHEIRSLHILCWSETANWKLAVTFQQELYRWFI